MIVKLVLLILNEVLIVEFLENILVNYFVRVGTYASFISSAGLFLKAIGFTFART